MEQTTDSMVVTTRSVGIRYGIILSLISIVFFLVFANFAMETYLSIGRWGNTILSIVIIVLAHIYYKQNGDGFMNFGQGVGIAFWTGLVSSAIGSVFTYVYIKFSIQA